MPAKVESTRALPGLSPVCGKPIIARFDGGQLSSDGGVLALREIEARLGIAERLAACVVDPRTPERVIHPVADILRFRMLMIAAGYEDGNDADSLRHDPAFKLALGRLPDGAALCSQPTISRLENLPRPRDLLRMGQAMVGLYCASFRQVTVLIGGEQHGQRTDAEFVAAEHGEARGIAARFAAELPLPLVALIPVDVAGVAVAIAPRGLRIDAHAPDAGARRSTARTVVSAASAATVARPT